MAENSETQFAEQMFYTASKVFWAVAAPSLFCKLIIVIAAFLAILQRVKGAAWLSFIGLAGLVLGGTTPIGYWLMVPLENRFPSGYVESHRDPDGIILVGGANWGKEWVAFSRLSHRFPKARLLLSGVTHSATGDNSLREQFARLAGDPNRLIFEDRSLTTSENALYSKQIVTPQPNERWLLITSAMHMARTVGCFRHEGFRVEAYPIDFINAPKRALSFDEESMRERLGQLDVATKEWIGLLAYRLAGRTGTLFPAP